MNSWPKHDIMAVNYPRIAGVLCAVPQPELALAAALEKEHACLGDVCAAQTIHGLRAYTLPASHREVS